MHRSHDDAFKTPVSQQKGCFGCEHLIGKKAWKPKTLENIESHASVWCDVAVTMSLRWGNIVSRNPYCFFQVLWCYQNWVTKPKIIDL